MPSITIRNVPPDVRDELAARAAREGRSLQEHLLALLTRSVAQPRIDDLMERVRVRKAVAGIDLDTDVLLDALDADRR